MVLPNFWWTGICDPVRTSLLGSRRVVSMVSPQQLRITIVKSDICAALCKHFNLPSLFVYWLYKLRFCFLAALSDLSVCFGGGSEVCVHVIVVTAFSAPEVQMKSFLPPTRQGKIAVNKFISNERSARQKSPLIWVRNNRRDGASLSFSTARRDPGFRRRGVWGAVITPCRQW